MKEYFTNFVTSAIQKNFVDTYKNASRFISTPLYHQCIRIISNVFALGEIGVNNDRGIPPVQTLLSLLEECGYKTEELSDYESICMGELMAFVFKHILGYKSQRDNVTIKENSFGIKTAALYYDRQEFEISDFDGRESFDS